MTRTYQKFEELDLKKLITESVSFTDVLRKCNKKPAGGSIHNLSQYCKRLGIDTSHFTGQAHNKGTKSNKRKAASLWFVMGTFTNHRVEASKLRRAMLETGFVYRCAVCTLNEWMDKPITLEIDHIDGRYWNNLRENLQFLCPSFHPQKSY